MTKLPKFNELNTCHFITTKVWQDIWLFKEEKYCQIIIDNLDFYRNKFDFKLIAYAVLPWHLHLILMLSRRFNDISKVMQDFKKFTAIQIVQQLISDRRIDLLQLFSLTGRIEDYPATLGRRRYAGSEDPAVPAESVEYRPATGTPRSSDRGSKKPARSEDLAVPLRRRKYQIWLPDNYDFNIYSYEKLEQKVGYVNNNAVKHGLVNDPIDWKFCSARNYYLNDHSVIKIDDII